MYGDAQSGAKGLYPAYWREFWKRVDERGGVTAFNVRARSSPARGWIPLVRTSIPRVFFSAVASVAKGKIEADFTLENEDVSRELFAALEERRHQIESAFGRALCWKESTRSKKNKCRIFLRKNDVSLRERDEWHSQHEWIIEHVENLYRAIVRTGVLELGDSE